MGPYSQFPADLVTFSEEILNSKLHFLCNGSYLIHFSVQQFQQNLKMVQLGSARLAQKVLQSQTSNILLLLYKRKREVQESGHDYQMVQNNHRKLSSRYFPVIHVLNNTNQPKIALDKVSVRNYKCQVTFGDLQTFTIFTETLIFTEKKHNIIKICSKFK